MRLGRRDHLSLNRGPPGFNRGSPARWGLEIRLAWLTPGRCPGVTSTLLGPPRSGRAFSGSPPAAIGYRSSPASVVSSRRAPAPLRPRRMAAATLASRALAARDLAAAARRGRCVARRPRWAAHGPRAPRRHARRRARRGVHRRLGRRPGGPVAHPDPSDDAPRRRRWPLARGRDRRGYAGAGVALRLGCGVVRAGGPAGPRWCRGVRRGCGGRRVCARRRRRRGECPGGSALLLYRGTERHLGGYARGGSGRGRARARRHAGLGAAARRVALRGAGARRSGGLDPRGLLGGGGRRRHRVAVVAADAVNTPVLLVSGVTRRRRGAAAPVADASVELAAGEVVALVGPPGSGKTTLLEVAAARLAADAGAVTVAGVAAGTRAARVLLLDETLSGVDAGGRRAMCERVRELAASGVAVLLASSDLAAVERIAARVLVMRDGRLVREVPTAALLRERVLEILLDAPPAAPPPGFRLTSYGLQTDLGPRSAEAALALCREHRLAVRASRVRLRTPEDAVLDAPGDGVR